MSHKTGKRVLAATATSALAFAGLIAMPIAAHAATSATVTNVCGGAGLDYVTFPANSGKYTLKFIEDDGNDVTVDTTLTAGALGTTPVGTVPAGGTVTDGAATLSADKTTVKFTLPNGAYDANVTIGAKPLIPAFAIYDKDSNQLVDRDRAGVVNDAKCQVASIPAPTSKLATSGATAGTITVTKGTGLDWTIKSDTATGNTADSISVSGGSVGAAGTATASLSGTAVKLIWPANATASSTMIITVTEDGTDEVADLITVRAAPGDGYTGVGRDFEFKLDAKTQVAYVAPTKNDRDGADSDTFTVRNITGVNWYYAPKDSTDDWAGTDANPTTGWEKVTFQTGETSATITRPAEVKADGGTATFRVVAVLSNPDDYKWDAPDTDSNPKVENQTFTDTKHIRTIPAPELVDGDGANDYYILPAVEGVEWTVTPGSGNDIVYKSNNPLLGTRIPVYTYGASHPPVTYTFVASEEDGYEIDTTTVTKTTWTQDYDSRAAITPAAPSFNDRTGLFEDSVTFPALASGLTGYKIGVASTEATAKSNAGTTTPRYVDGTWYGKSVLLTDLQRTLLTTPNVTSDVWVYIEALPNTSIYKPATDADGNQVKVGWSYKFTNAVNVTPEPPVMNDQPGTANDTLTFPLDPRVNYKVTQGGVTKTISYADRGKALPYTGQVTVTPEAATGYLLQPNTDGTAPKPWVFTFDQSNEVKPGAPHSYDEPGTDQDTYEVPNQPGVLWSVDGVNLDPSQYGKRIATGGKTEMTFVARPATGYKFADDAETTFALHWSTKDHGDLGAPEVDHTVRASGWQADVEWSAPEDAEGDVTYDVSFAKVTEDEDGDEVVGPRTTWFEGTDVTSARINAGFNTVYRVYVTAIDEDGVESQEGETTITFATDNSGAEANWTDINRSTVTPSGNDALGWYQAGSSLYFNNTAFVTYRDQSNITFTVNGGQQLRVYGTQYTKGGRALIQVNGTNWAWLDAGASSNADPYKKMLRQINLPNTGTHTIKIIASLLPGKELALDAYEVVK